MANYVKFQRGSQDAYNALKQAGRLDNNTLYFIYDDADKSAGALYLGTRFISGGDATVTPTNLDDLADVIVNGAGTNSFLVKNEEDVWVAKSLEDVIALIEDKLQVDPAITENVSKLQDSVNDIIEDIGLLEDAINEKADSEFVNEELAKKADAETVNTALSSKADAETVNAALDEKANIEDVNAALDAKADAETVNAALDKKADVETVNAALDTKANIEDVNEELAKKADAETVNAALSEKANINDVYTKEEVNDKVATEINTAISNVDHLQRKVVNNLDEIDEDAVDAHLYIYMVPTGLQQDDDKYDEYMVINGVIEKVGSWEVDLSQYAKAEDLKKKVDVVEGSRLMTEAEGEKLAALKVEAEKNYISSVASEFKVEEGKLELVSIGQDKITGLTETLSNIDGKFVAVNEALEGKVDAVEGSRLITNDEAKKLGALVLEGDNVAISGTVGAAKVQELYDNVLRIVTGSGFAEYDGQQRALLNIAPGAEVNVIQTANLNDFTIDENRTLNLNDIAISKITNLQESLDAKVNIADLNENHFVVSDGTISLKESYVTTELYQAEVGDLSKLMHSALLEDGSINENSTLVDEINYINERLTWVDMNI